MKKNFIFMMMICILFMAGHETVLSASKPVELKTKEKILNIGDNYKLKLRNNKKNWKISNVFSDKEEICEAENKATYIKLTAKRKGNCTINVTLTLKTTKKTVKHTKLQCKITVQSPDPESSRKRVEKDGFEVGSWVNDGQVEINYDETYGSKYSYCISTEKRNAFNLIKKFPVKQNTYYVASAYIKTENLENKEQKKLGANISYNDFIVSPTLMGNHDWTKIELLVYSGDNTELPISFNYGFTCNTCVGKMYLDQIELKEYQVPDTAEWKMLFLIFKNSKIPMKDSTGQDIIGQNGVSEKEIEDIKKAVLQFKEDSYKDSNGKLNVDVEVKVIDKPIEKTEETIYGPYPPADYIYELIKDDIDIDEYDYIGALGNLNTIEPKFAGLTHYPFYQGTGYMFCNTQITDFSEKSEWTPAIIVHEFLHFMISYRSQWLQKEVPIDLDKAESYGYQHIEEWRQYYIDIMNGNLILENGEKTGITDKAFWNITPKDFRYTVWWTNLPS